MRSLRVPRLTTPQVSALGIAFRAKPVVKEGAGHAISTLGLDAVLYLLGFRDRDIE